MSAACSSYTGTATLHDAAVDSDAPKGGGACGPRGVCDPITGGGCPEGSACGLGGDGVATCSAREGRAAFAVCATTAQCAAGLSCIALRCVRLCCGDEACGDLSNGTARSRCAVETPVEGFYGCTRPGSCDYVLQTGCASGQHCYPTSLHGGGSCLPTGRVVEGGACRGPSECEWPFTCLGSPGICRRVCSVFTGGCPGDVPCLQFADRPADFGHCE